MHPWFVSASADATFFFLAACALQVAWFMIDIYHPWSLCLWSVLGNHSNDMVWETLQSAKRLLFGPAKSRTSELDLLNLTIGAKSLSKRHFDIKPEIGSNSAVWPITRLGVDNGIFSHMPWALVNHILSMWTSKHHLKQCRLPIA